MNPRDYDPYRVAGCALFIASALVVLAFFARTVEEMRHLFSETDA